MTDVTEPHAFIVPSEWDLRPQEAKFFAALAETDGAVSSARLLAVIGGKCAPHSRIVAVIASKVRAKLSKALNLPSCAIVKNVWGQGYRLTDGVRALISEQERAAA